MEYIPVKPSALTSCFIKNLVALPCMSIFQTAEEVSFAANGITADGLKAFDGILQSNVALKTLDLSGNAFGDEGAKVTSYGACLAHILLELIYSKKHKLHQTLKREKSAFKVERKKLFR